MNPELLAKADALLVAAEAFWTEAYRSGCGGAVQWLEDTDGRLLIFTRGEYRDQIYKNVHRLGLPVHQFNTGEDPAE